MKIFVQAGGTPLTEEEIKEITALLVKLGYVVRRRREKDAEKGVLKRVVYAEVEGAEK